MTFPDLEKIQCLRDMRFLFHQFKLQSVRPVVRF